MFQSMMTKSLLLFVIVISVVLCYVLKEPSEFLHDDHALAEALLKRVKKHDRSVRYPEQCEVIQSWKEKPGLVKVLAFLDTSWPFSHNQAVMLKLLKNRLEKSGLLGIRFFAVILAPSIFPIDEAELDDERVAWEAVSTTENLGAPVVDDSIDALAKETGSDIQLIQDTPELRIWEKLHVTRDQIVVIDQCGRLTYQVIVPWSILHYAYVKAAILSTYNDEPCGSCDLQSLITGSSTTSRIETTAKETTTSAQIEEFVGDVRCDDNNAASEVSVDLAINTTKRKESTEHYERSTYASTQATTVGMFENHSFNSSTSIPSSIDQHPDEKPDDNEFNFAPGTTISPFDDEVILGTSEETLNIETYSFTEESERKDDYGEVNETDKESSRTISMNSEYDEVQTMNNTKIDKLDDAEVMDKERTNDFEGSPFTTMEPENVRSENVRDSESSIKDAEPKNHIVRNAPRSGEDLDSDEHAAMLPIRIIMHAPHVHEYGYEVKKHEYLILKTGEPAYHEHLGSGEEMSSADERLFFGNVKTHEHEEHVTEHGLKIENDWEVGDSKQNVKDNGKKADLREKGSDERNEKNETSSVIYGKDESPGFYGEDADYLTNYGYEGFHEKLEETSPYENQTDIKVNQPGYDEVEIFQGEEYDSPTMKACGTVTKVVIEGRIFEKIEGCENLKEMEEQVSESTEQTIQDKDMSNNEDSRVSDALEEEVKSKLIAHYSKLLPWISYVLDSE